LLQRVRRLAVDGRERAGRFRCLALLCVDIDHDGALAPIAFNNDSAIRPRPPAPKITIGRIEGRLNLLSAL